MKPISFIPGQLRAFITAVLISLAGVAGATTLSVSPSTVSNLYSGALSVHVAGLTNGETVLVERFLDPNANGVIDAGEPLVQSFLVTDGQVSSIGGIRNANIPGDTDLSANGQIAASLSFANAPEFSQGSGAQIFRVSSPTGRFAAVQQSITITQSALARQISGTVSSGGSPLSHAWVAALLQVGTDQQLVSATTANGSGNFSLNVTNGTYVVMAFKPGYSGNFSNSPQVTIAGNNTNVNIPLTAATLTVSGKISDTSSGVGVPGVQIFADSVNNDYLVMFSDAQGNFSTGITPGQWKLDPSDLSAMLGGYMRSQNKTKVSVSTANVTGVSISFTKGTALIYGTLKTDQNVALGRIRLFGNDGSLYQSTAYTDANGNFFLPASGGTWYFGVDQGASLPPGYVVQQAQANLTAGQAFQLNLVATHATAYLAGRAFDGNNNLISGGSMIAFSGNGPGQSVQLATDGSFVLPVTGGNWTLSLDTQTAASRNLVPSQLPFTVTDGVNVSNIVYVAPIATRMISGSVKTPTNTPIAGINVYAGAMINGTNYNANANTDANGNYSLPVLAGMWFVGLDSQGLSQLGYGSVPNHNVDTTSGNQTANFIVGGQPIGTIFFRQSMGVIGEFGHSSTPIVTYPVVPKNYRVMFHVFNDTNPPTTGSVLFTGPPGSGLTNSPADPVFGVVRDGTNAYYLSSAVKTPSAAQGGTWTVNYNGNVNTFQTPDPQVYSRIVVPLPTIAISNGLLTTVNWSYRDSNGNVLPGTPGFILNNRLDLFDQNGGLFDSEVLPITSSFSYPNGSALAWANIGLLRMAYYDNLTNQYFFNFSESSPTLTGVTTLSGHTWQFLLNGAASQNYTVQYATRLGPANWSLLYVTNVAASPLTIVDPDATNSARFYRVLVGP